MTFSLQGRFLKPASTAAGFGGCSDLSALLFLLKNNFYWKLGGVRALGAGQTRHTCSSSSPESQVLGCQMQRMLTFQVRRIRVNPLSGALSLALKTHRHLLTSCLLPQTCLERIPPQLHLKSALPRHRLQFVTLPSAGTNSPPSVTLAGSTLCSFVAGVICLVCLQSTAFPVSKPPWASTEPSILCLLAPPAPQLPVGAHLSVHGWGGAQVGGDVLKIMAGGGGTCSPNPWGRGKPSPQASEALPTFSPHLSPK